jgi:hypothetical protein
VSQWEAFTHVGHAPGNRLPIFNRPYPFEPRQPMPAFRENPCLCAGAASVVRRPAGRARLPFHTSILGIGCRPTLAQFGRCDVLLPQAGGHSVQREHLRRSGPGVVRPCRNGAALHDCALAQRGFLLRLRVRHFGVS